MHILQISQWIMQCDKLRKTEQENRNLPMFLAYITGFAIKVNVLRFNSQIIVLSKTFHIQISLDSQLFWFCDKI
jgi:hypothetical protein